MCITVQIEDTGTLGGAMGCVSSDEGSVQNVLLPMENSDGRAKWKLMMMFFAAGKEKGSHGSPIR
jgi:hypothetical protein